LKLLDYFIFVLSYLLDTTHNQEAAYHSCTTWL